MYYNPKCSKCRATLALLQEKGIEPELIHYLEAAPTTAMLAAVLDKLGKGAKDVIRFNEDVAKELGISPADDRLDAEWLNIISAATGRRLAGRLRMCSKYFREGLIKSVRGEYLSETRTLVFRSLPRYTAQARHSGRTENVSNHGFRT
jgi:arsenate reductase (glutaredoxin)